MTEMYIKEVYSSNFIESWGALLMYYALIACLDLVEGYVHGALLTWNRSDFGFIKHNFLFSSDPKALIRSNVLSIVRLSHGLEKFTNQVHELKMLANCDDAVHNLELIKRRMTDTSVHLTRDEAQILKESFE